MMWGGGRDDGGWGINSLLSNKSVSWLMTGSVVVTAVMYLSLSPSYRHLITPHSACLSMAVRTLRPVRDNFLKRKKINIPVFLTLRYCDIVLMASCNQLECKAMFRKRLVVPQSPRNQNISSSPHPSQFARFSCLCRWRQLLDFYCENEKCVEVERTEESSLPIVKFSPEQSLSVSFQFDVDFYPSLAWLGEIKCRIKVGNLHLVRAEGGSLDPQLTTKQSLFPEQKDW